MRKILFILVSSLIVIVLITIVSRNYSFDEIRSLILQINQSFLLLYLACVAFALLLRAWRYKVVLLFDQSALGKVSIYHLLVVTSVRNALVDFIPARMGEVSFFYILKRFKISLTNALATFALCFILDIFVLLVVFLFVLIWQGSAIINSFSTLEVSQLLLSSIICLSAVVSGVILFKLDFICQLVSGILKKINFNIVKQLAISFEKMADQLKQVTVKKEYSLLILLTLGLRGAKYAGLYFLLLAVVLPMGVSGSSFPPVISTLSFILAEATASLPMSGFMGFGAYEIVWSTLMSNVFETIGKNMGIILVIHIVTQIVGYAIGLLGAICFLVFECMQKRAYK